jgi:eukaryotic-like serine/threonine-protein kinase
MFPGCLRLILYDLGQHEAGLEESLEFRRRSFTPYAQYGSFAYHIIAHGYLFLNQADKASAAVEEARTKGLGSDLGSVPYDIAFYRSDTTKMAREGARAMGKPGEEDLLLELEADTAAYFGHLGKARQLSLEAADSAEHAGEREVAAGYYVVSALRETLFGHYSRMQPEVTVAKERSLGRDTLYALALTFAYAEKTKWAKELADDLSWRFPEDTVVQVNYLPTLRAKLALSQANPQGALDILKAAAPYELGVPANGFYNWPNLYPVYVRGDAYLAAHQGKEAAGEFQKILDHRGIVLNEPIGALAHLQLGRAYAMQGDDAKARTAYQDFLTLWKDADPDVPILQQAKAEYAKLESAPGER